MKKKGKDERKILGMLIVLMAIISVFTGLMPVLAEESPGGEEGMPVPSAMTLTADPEWIYINGDESLITATIYDNANYTDPIPNMVVFFETTRGILTPVSYGGSESPTKCWAMTNESGVAIAALAPVIGSESGNATVKAVTGKGDVWETVTVEFVKAEWRVVLFPDEESKETEANEDATYYIMVRNAGTADDTYDLSIPSNEADYAALNKTIVSLAANTSEIVTLTVRDSTIGIYNTTVRAASAHANWEVTLRTIVRAYGVELKVEGGDYAEKTVAPSETALYSVTVKNTGNGIDSYDLSVDNVSAADVAVLDQYTVTNLAAGVSAEVLLSVSDATVGEYVVNVTATSQGNPSVSDTITTVTNVSAVVEPDLIVTEITPNRLFANQSNEICATVKNNGTGAAGAFNVSFNVDGFSEEVRVDGLATGEDTTMCVIDPTWRAEGESVTITVMADSDAEIDESNETNNEGSIGVTVETPTETTFNITISPGWNLISIPLELTNTTLGAVIGGNATFMDEIYEFDNVAGYSASMYTPQGWAGPVTDFEPGKGYWYNRQGSEFELSVTGQPPTGTKTTPIYTGWNLIGYSSLRTQDLGIVNDPEIMDEIYEFDSVAGYSASMYTPQGWAGPVTDFEPGKGYWYNRQGSEFNWVYTA